MKIRVLVTGMLGALVLAGCGAGQDAATAQTRPSIPGVDADAGDLQVRNAVVAFSPAGYAPGDDAPVEFSIANAGQEPVRLVVATSEGATSVTVASATQIGAASPAPGGTPAPTGTPEPGGTPAPTGGDAEVAVAPGQFFAVTLQLTGLRQALDGTGAVPVTLTFDNGVELPLAVPMDTPLEEQPRESAVVPPAEH